MKKSLHAVTLVVPDYTSAIAFYVDTMGFDLLQDIDLDDGKRWVRVAPPGTTEGSLLLARAAEAPQEAIIGAQTGGRVGFFLSTDDFIRDYDRMRANGVFFEEEPRQEPYGTVAVWQDPFGNRWDLIEFN